MCINVLLLQEKQATQLKLHSCNLLSHFMTEIFATVQCIWITANRRQVCKQAVITCNKQQCWRRSQCAPRCLCYSNLTTYTTHTHFSHSTWRIKKL